MDMDKTRSAIRAGKTAARATSLSAGRFYLMRQSALACDASAQYTVCAT